MQLKYPGGNLAWLTILWFIASCFLTCSFYAADRYWLGGLFACLAIACLLVWLDVRFVYKPLVGFWTLAIACGLLAMVWEGFTFSRAWQILLAGYTIYALHEWGTEYDRQIEATSSYEPVAEGPDEVTRASRVRENAAEGAHPSAPRRSFP